jgi:GT2 family glycosyltransferase
MPTQAKLSVIIVNWNTKQLLLDCIKSIFEQKQDFPLEVIVVDNGSSDGSVAAVAQRFPQTRLITNQDNVGFAKANNQAIRIAYGEYILLLNSDTLILGDALAQMVRFLDAHPEAGAVGCKLLNADGALQLSACNFPDLSTLVFETLYLDKIFPRSRLFGRYYLTYWDHNDIREVHYVSGACLMVRKRTIEQVGLLDEDYFMYAEEMDWCYRMKKLGWKVYYLPTAEVIHYGGQSSKAIPAETFQYHLRSLLLFFRKHYGLRCAMVARFIILFNVITRLFVLQISYLNSVGSPSKRGRVLRDLRVYKEALKWVLAGRL